MHLLVFKTHSLTLFQLCLELQGARGCRKFREFHNTFYDIKTVLMAFVCLYESLKLIKLWMSNISFFLMCLTRPHFLVTAEQKDHFCRTHSTEAETSSCGLFNRSMSPCTAGTHTVHRRVTRICRDILKEKHFKFFRFMEDLMSSLRSGQECSSEGCEREESD